MVDLGILLRKHWRRSSLEKAEAILFVSSGMYAVVAMMSALVPAGGHIITTACSYGETRIFLATELPKMGNSITTIEPADIDSSRDVLEKHNVNLFFTNTPTNPLSRCIDIELVSKLCHNKGAIVCIDGTYATPINQKPLLLGADLVLHSASKYLNGHNDVLGGCISGSEELITRVRKHHCFAGGVLNPNAAYMILRGMKTLHLRAEQRNDKTLRMAQFLEMHPKLPPAGNNVSIPVSKVLGTTPRSFLLQAVHLKMILTIQH